MMETILHVNEQMKSFLELAQPLEVRFGYIRGVVQDKSYLTYRNISTTPRIGIGNKLISERTTFVVTLQTKTAEQNLIYSSLIRYATSGSNVNFIAEDLRRDVTVENGWINTFVLSIFNGEIKKLYTKSDVYILLQEIANRYIMITSVYKKPFRESIIEKFVVPELSKETYTYEEVMQLKQEYLDRYLLTITEY